MESKESRVTMFVVAVAVAIGLFFLFQNDDDSEPAETPAEVTTQATTTADSADSDRPAKPKPKPKPEIPTIVVVGGEPKGGVAELNYKSGDRIKFEVRSDVAEEVHVHGYDVTADVPAGGKETLSFPAELEGIFEVELHGSGALIAELTVEP